MTAEFTWKTAIFTNFSASWAYSLSSSCCRMLLFAWSYV